MKTNDLLNIKNLGVWYTKGKPVIKGLDLDIAPGEITGLIGLNGAGKTTLIKTISGILDSFTADSILHDGKSFSFRDEAFKMSRFVVYSEDHSFGELTFDEYCSYVFKSYKKPETDTSGLVKGFHFEEYTGVPMKELSMGNRKKASLITAFALRPELLILDEPVNGLDFQSTEYLYKQIYEYRTCGSLLFSSHILESICLTSDRVIVLENGTISNTFKGDEITPEQVRGALNEQL